ncbi:MAG TPA: SDR family oxidoreductase, partial [Steroidobacteraceae bacterium]|nr:SDR family oxidoreductase [Steroidobacteraceae bacterium]
AYAVSKFALEGLSQVLADELSGSTRVRVNTINPGPARTLMRRQAYPSENLESVPLPETLLEPYLQLLGPRGAGTTGQALNCQ